MKPKLNKTIVTNWRRVLLQMIAIILSAELTLTIYFQELTYDKMWGIPCAILFVFLSSNLLEFIRKEDENE